VADALSQLSKEELISYAKMLLAGAVDRLEMDMPSEAAWRIANALGSIGTVLADSPQAVPGIDVPTTLGYQLVHHEETTNTSDSPM
jgi:hypothetical protein